MRMGPRSALMRGFPVRNGAWNTQLHFRARSDFAPHLELPPNLLGALAHAWQSPVSIASRFEELRINALAIIPDTQPKKTFAVCDLRFDFTCLRMAERIAQRLARNAVNVVPEDGMQVARCALYGNEKRC